jgi:hypothetical protein
MIAVPDGFLEHPVDAPGERDVLPWGLYDSAVETLYSFVLDGALVIKVSRL